MWRWLSGRKGKKGGGVFISGFAFFLWSPRFPVFVRRFSVLDSQFLLLLLMTSTMLSSFFCSVYPW